MDAGVVSSTVAKSPRLMGGRPYNRARPSPEHGRRAAAMTVATSARDAMPSISGSLRQRDRVRADRNAGQPGRTDDRVRRAAGPQLPFRRDPGRQEGGVGVVEWMGAPVAHREGAGKDHVCPLRHRQQIPYRPVRVLPRIATQRNEDGGAGAREGGPEGRDVRRINRSPHVVAGRPGDLGDTARRRAPADVPMITTLAISRRSCLVRSPCPPR